MLKRIRGQIERRFFVCFVCLGLLDSFEHEEPITEETSTSVFGEHGSLLGPSWALGLTDYFGNQLDCRATHMKSRIEGSLEEHLRPCG